MIERSRWWIFFRKFFFSVFFFFGFLYSRLNHKRRGENLRGFSVQVWIKLRIQMADLGVER